MGQEQSYVAEEERRKAEELERQRQIAEEREGKFKGYLVQTGSKAVAIAVFTTCVCLSLSVWYRTITGKGPKPLFGVEKIHLDREPTGRLQNEGTSDSSSASSSYMVPSMDHNGGVPTTNALKGSEHYDLKPMEFETSVQKKESPPTSPPSSSEPKQIPGMTISKNSDNTASGLANKMKKESKKEQKRAAAEVASKPQATQGEKVPFSLTYVMYNPQDPYGELVAIITLAPIFIVVMYATLIVMRRDIDTILIFLGQLMSVAINVLVKKMIKEPRPIGAHLDDEGMPSNHAQFIFFFAMYYTLELLFRSPRRVCPYLLRLFYTSVLLVLALLVSLSRVYLNYHTFEQVVVGAVLGAFNAFIWSFVCNSKIVVCICDYACKTWLFQYLSIRNYYEIEYSAVEEYIAINGYIANLAYLPNYAKTSTTRFCDMKAPSISSYHVVEKNGATNLEDGLDDSKSKKSHDLPTLSNQKSSGLRQRDRESAGNA